MNYQNLDLHLVHLNFYIQVIVVTLQPDLEMVEK